MNEELTTGEMKMKSELILIPAPAVGHLVSAGEFTKRLLDRDVRFSKVTILLINSPRLTHQIESYKASLAAEEPRVRFIDVPRVDPPPPELAANAFEHYFTLLIESHKPHVKQIVETLVSDRAESSDSGRVVGFLLDFFCVSMIDVANELGLPSYIYLTSNTAFLSMMLYLPSRHERVNTEFTESDPEFVIPGFTSPVPPRVLPSAVFNKDGAYAAFVKVSKRFREAKGLIVNTVMELESSAISTLSAKKTPGIYTVGPVIDLKGEGQNNMGSSVKSSQGIRIQQWLDGQPPKSVVFLCFGSSGVLPAPQLREIATGLDRSGYRFVWSIREPANCSNTNEILPDGFLERTTQRGLVCGWVPQVEILAHDSIGGFVSHCGWNSILESLWNGVPIVTWPMYAEQQLNAFVMVKELGMAVEMRLDYRRNGSEVVAAEEIEAAVRAVMEKESKVRERVGEAREKCRKAVEEGGSSYDMIGRLIEDVLS